MQKLNNEPKKREIKRIEILDFTETEYIVAMKRGHLILDPTELATGVVYRILFTDNTYSAKSVA